MSENNSSWSFYLKVYGIFLVCVYILNVYLGKEYFNALFQAVNSIGLFVVGIYVFKKHAIPVIMGEIEQDRIELQQLHNCSDTLNSRKHILEQRLVCQKELVVRLDDKIHVWREAWINKNKEKERERVLIGERLTEKRTIQSHYATRDQIYKKIAADALDKARASLEEQFSSIDSADHFLQELIEYIGEERQ